jgi:hypothetical protein
MDLNLSANINNPDDFYEKLIDMQRDLSEYEVQMANAKLILILANHIGDQQVIDAAIKLARAA